MSHNRPLVYNDDGHITQLPEGVTFPPDVLPVVGAVLLATFSSTAANVNNKFLDTEGIGASDDLPAVVTFDGTLSKLSFSTTSLTGSGIVGIIEIRVNTSVGTPATSFALTDNQTQNFNCIVPVLKGDFLTCKIADGANNIAKPVLKLYQ